MQCNVHKCRLWQMRHVIACTRFYTRLKIRDVWKKTLSSLIQKASRCAADCTSKIATLFSFTFYITQRSYEKTMCIYFLFHWFSDENCIIFLFSLHKERQTSKELKRNMNDGTIVFTYRLNLKNSSSLFFLIQDNFMF